MELLKIANDLIAATLGILAVAFHNAYYANREKFNFRIWLDENLTGIAFSFAGMFLVICISALIPDAGGVIEQNFYVKLPESGNLLAWFVTGGFLYSRARKSGRKPKS